MSCALELLDSAVKCLVLEKGDRIGSHLGTLPYSIKNFAGGLYENGEALRRQMAQAAEAAGCNLRVNQEVIAADLGKLKLTTRDGDLFARTILIATGNRRRKLGLSNESAFGDEVTYDIASLPPQHFAGQSIVVVGGGDSATLDALELAEIASEVFLIHRAPALAARPDIIDKVNSHEKIKVLLRSEIVSLNTPPTLKSINARCQGQQREITATRLVIKIGEAPNTEVFAGQVNMTPTGHIIVDQSCATSVANVFAAGDITMPGYPRIATAVGQGILAACSIRKFLEARI